MSTTNGGGASQAGQIQDQARQNGQQGGGPPIGSIPGGNGGSGGR
jgi:hypothetical protein